jgi:hypothetical protein
MDLEKIRKDSVIFQAGKKPLSTYQSTMNDVSLKLCLDDPTLLLAREQVHNEGYQYKKKKSSSTVFGSATNQMKDPTAPKKPKWSQELRSKRIKENEEDLSDLDTRVKCIERSREKFISVQQYEHAAEKCKEVTTLRGEKRKLQLEMAQLQKLEAKTTKYHSSVLNKSLATGETCSKKSEGDPRQCKLLVMEHVAEDENNDVNERDVTGSSCGSDKTTSLEDPFLEESQRPRSKMKN